jgi:hypothetical protein
MRFGTKSLLTAMAVVAVWIASYKATPGIDYFIRKCILLAILLAAGSAAVGFRDKQRAFWGGFFATMLILGQRNIIPVYTRAFSR